MIYTKAFFDLQLQFADKVAVLSGLPLARVLLEYTNLYARFGLGRDFDPAHPTWREYLAGLQDTNDTREWTYRFYLARPEVIAAPGVVATFGCFSYAQLSGDRIRLHFHNAETDGHSPLGIERLGHRLADLAALFTQIKRTLRQPVQVIGASWLYNLDAYRRLFPASYLATAHVTGHRFQHMPLWGQFVDRHGEIKTSMRRQFLERLERQSSVDSLDQCFPFQVLSLEASVLAFYEFYGIEAPPTDEQTKPEMTPGALVDLLQRFDSAGIEVWLDGGWAVDALLGVQTRPHKDLDIILRVSDLPTLRGVLERRGFEVQHGGTESNFVLADRSGLEVDVHAIVFDRDGNGVYRMASGSDWIFPAEGFTGRGVIQGIGVRCLSPETQVLCHAHGYVSAEKDFRDMALLQARFGVALPPYLRRNQ